MNDTIAVGMLQGASNIENDVDGIADVQGTMTVEQFMGAGAIDVFQNDVVQSRVGVSVSSETANDVRMGQHGAVPAFEMKALQDIRPGRVLRGQDLDGDLPILFGVKGEIDRTHAALAEPTQNAIRSHLSEVVALIVGRLLTVFCRLRPSPVDLRRRVSKSEVLGLQFGEQLGALQGMQDVRRIIVGLLKLA